MRLGSGLDGRVDGNQQVEDVVVDREDTFVTAVVELAWLAVLHVLEDVEVLAADRIEYLGLDLAVGEPGVACVYLEARRMVLVDVAGDAEQR